MKGHITERSPGKWAIVLDIPDPATGKRRRKWHSFTGGRREAQKECARLISELSGGLYQEPHKTTLAEFLNKWLAAQKSQVAPRTFERYEEIARKNIAPLLGNAILTKLKPHAISSAYAKALESGRRKGGGGLSPRTVHHIHTVLKQALEQAVHWEVLVRNPAARVDPPKVERKPMSALDAPQIALLLNQCRPTRMFIPVLLAVMCGLRRGEVAALKWKSVNIDGASMSIVESLEQTKDGVRAKETKAGRSRNVALSAMVIEELRRWRALQAEELLRLGAKATGNTPVITQADGSGLQPNSISRAFERLRDRAANLPRIRFHDLRHTHATQMLANGVHPKVAQERLGHSTIAITLDLYSHVMPGMQEDAAAKVDAAIRQAIEKAAKGVG